MMRAATARRLVPQTIVRVIALAGMLVASGVAAVSATAAGRQQTGAATVRISYICRFPAGPQRTAVTIAAAFPGAGVAGRPIQPRRVELTAAIPPKGVAALAATHASTVSASARLLLGIEQRGQLAVHSVWSGLASHLTPVPVSGPLTLGMSGAVPPFTARAAGTATVAAAGLNLVLTPHGASASPAPAHGPAVLPPTLHVDCAPAPGQADTLATVPVAAAPQHHPGNRARHHYCPKQPKGGYKRNPRFPLPKPPPGSKILFPSLEAGCAYTEGYADVHKFDEAGFIQPGLGNLSVNARIAYKQSANYFQSDNYGKLYYHGLPEFPPSRTTFLAFGFMPAFAMLHLHEIGTLNAVAVGPYSVTLCKHACPTVVTISSRLFIRISDVAVNGVPLDVGSNCGTAPFDAIVTGTSASKPAYSVTAGGPLTGKITIPPFRHCGVGENLDPLFTGAISGTENFTLLTQGKICFLIGGGVCPPAIPKPLHSVTG